MPNVNGLVPSMFSHRNSGNWRTSISARNSYHILLYSHKWVIPAIPKCLNYPLQPSPYRIFGLVYCHCFALKGNHLTPSRDVRQSRSRRPSLTITWLVPGIQNTLLSCRIIFASDD
jgi:hypothetical protein